MISLLAPQLDSTVTRKWSSMRVLQPHYSTEGVSIESHIIRSLGAEAAVYDGSQEPRATTGFEAPAHWHVTALELGVQRRLCRYRDSVCAFDPTLDSSFDRGGYCAMLASDTSSVRSHG